MSDTTYYRASIWEADDGWHWRVEVDVPNRRAWSGVRGSFEIAAGVAADFLRAAGARVPGVEDRVAVLERQVAELREIRATIEGRKT